MTGVPVVEEEEFGYVMRLTDFVGCFSKLEYDTPRDGTDWIKHA